MRAPTIWRGTTRLAFVVPGKPQGKQRPRLGKGGRVYTPAATTKYEAEVRKACLVAMSRGRIAKRQTCAIAVDVVCWFPDLRRRDGDNVLKAVQDALNDFLWVDDEQVVDARVRRGGIDRVCPRTEVVIELLDREAA
jgi:Holliday junction resolvase RusA-like endonuclease